MAVVFTVLKIEDDLATVSNVYLNRDQAIETASRLIVDMVKSNPAKWQDQPMMDDADVWLDNVIWSRSAVARDVNCDHITSTVVQWHPLV